mmetsp:Transcript_16938/g.36624  ORF Transcript_16938/g.36624 Transcript_16938/m.36624 type:complete len:235 (-) Transcript_16938:282-986(-)
MEALLAAVLFISCCMLSSTAFRPSPEISTGPIRTRSSVRPVLAQVEDNVHDSRRTFLISAAATLECTIAKPSASNAVYGADAKIEMPDIVQGMSDRNNKQCLVESLGNRECLVYLDPENQLYKGSDAGILFERLAKSIAALEDVPQYIENKQWNKVQGVLTGPMGTLSSTMNEIVKIVDDAGVQSKCKVLSVDIRKDLYAIAAAADKKQVREASVSYEKAEQKLYQFVSLVSSV